MIGPLTNHLWQSTVFAVAAGLLTIALRKNRAQVRYWVWFSASSKVPGSVRVADESREPSAMGAGRPQDRDAFSHVRDGANRAAIL